MVLIIAEKPSLARNISSALGNTQKKGNGCIFVGDFIVTWAFGHLFSLADIEHYQGKSTGGKTRWTIEGLPCFPERFDYQLRRPADASDTGVEKQFSVIRSLCLRNDVDTIVNAGDSDREGEIIVRLCVLKSFGTSEYTSEKCGGKRLCRLWLPDQTPETIRAAVRDMKDEREYDDLANEGFARTFTDWLYGVNLTRFATLKCGTLIRVGRVIVPIVKAVYDRDMAIRDFKPEKYYTIASKEKTNGETVELVSKLRFDAGELREAEKKCALYDSLGAYVLGVKKKKEKLNAGKLWSLTKLQSFLGKKFKMPMPRSLEVLQELYEKGFVTYPRTNSEYLATAEKDKVKKVLAAVGKLGYPVVFKDSKSIFDDTKIESHSALTPTTKMPDKDRLSEDEKKVYGAIMRRFAAVFCAKDCIAEKTELTIRVGERGTDGVEDFTLKGTVIIEPGWTKYDDYNAKDKVLPRLAKGDTVNIAFHPVEKETTPPKHYTIETLNNYLKNPFREELSKKGVAKPKSDAEEDENTENDTGSAEEAAEYRAMFEGLELGTEATRTSIIDNARKSGYIELKKDVYTILPDGEYLVESLSRMNIGMDKYKTAELGKALKKVFRGEMSIEDSTAVTEREISEIFRLDRESGDGFAGDVVGKCPLCGGNVIRGKYGYGCAEWKKGCKFRIYSPICSRPLKTDEVRKLLKDGMTDVLDGFLSKKGNNFSARVKLEGNGTKLVFENKPESGGDFYRAPEMDYESLAKEFAPTGGFTGSSGYIAGGYADGGTGNTGGYVQKNQSGSAPDISDYISGGYDGEPVIHGTTQLTSGGDKSSGK